MIEKAIRGGICQAVHRYAKANNKYMREQFNPKKPSTYTQYLDMNNEYGTAMCKKLPVREFKWCMINRRRY